MNTEIQIKMTNENIASDKKKILLISYHFPPSAAIGGQRIVNFAKYLPKYGWDTSVLTVQDRYFDAVDRKSLADVETCRIIRTRQLPKLIEGYRKLKETYFRIREKASKTHQNPMIKNPSPAVDLTAPEKLFQKLNRWFISLFLTLPDTEKSWILLAVYRAVREIRNQGTNCILTTCPPYSAHLIGLLVKMITSVKWAADFRDPWMTAGTKLIFTSKLSNSIESFLEKKVVQKTDLLTFNSHRLKDAYKTKYSGELDTEFAFIPNGVNMQSFARIRNLKKYDKFTLSYTGVLYGDRSPEPIFKALSQLAHEGNANLSEINVKLVGNCQFINGHPISSMIHAYGLESVVEVLDQVSRLKALEIIRQSHLALLFAPNQPFQIPSKVYDYMGTGTSILAITEDGATSDLLRSTHCGGVFRPADTDGIKEFILQAMNEEVTYDDNCERNISHLEAKNITEGLADLLRNVVLS